MSRVKAIFTLIAVREMSFDPEWYQNDACSLPIETIFQRAAKEVQEDPCDFVDFKGIRVEAFCRSPEDQAVFEYKQILAARLLGAIEDSIVEQVARIRDAKRLEVDLAKARDEVGILKLRVEQLEQQLQAAYQSANEVREEASRFRHERTLR